MWSASLSLTSPGPHREVTTVLYHLGLLLTCLLGANGPVPPLPPSPTVIMPLDEVQPGMRAVVYTVFTGQAIEPMTATVLGRVSNFFGPKRDILLIELEGEKPRHTGIVHGMSGSPVYIDNKLVGALSLQLSPFPKDPVAGVTPIAYMLGEMADASGDKVPAQPSPGMAPPVPDAPTPSGLKPLRAPLAVSGVSPSVLEPFRAFFEKNGFMITPGSAGGAGADKLGAANLVPGAPVAALLADGDLTLAATGTLTYRDKNRILAFGHPFTSLGRVAFPMVPADIVATLADQTESYKVANTGSPVGTIIFDRVTAVVGDIGRETPMLPVSVRFTQGGREVASYRYRVVKSSWFTPTLVAITVSNSISQRWEYNEEMTYRLAGSVKLAGGRVLPLKETYAVAPTPLATSPTAMAMDVAYILTLLYQNPIQTADVQDIALTYDMSEGGKIETLAQCYLDPEAVKPGETFRVKLRLKSYRGASRVVVLDVPVPKSVGAHRLGVRVVDSNMLDAEMASLGNPFDRAQGVDDLLNLLQARPTSDRFYVQLVSYEPDAVINQERLPSLPRSMLDVLAQGGLGGPFRILPRAVLWQLSVPVDGVALGAQEIPITVRQ